jgi:hypothetical protein
VIPISSAGAALLLFGMAGRRRFRRSGART